MELSPPNAGSIGETKGAFSGDQDGLPFADRPGVLLPRTNREMTMSYSDMIFQVVIWIDMLSNIALVWALSRKC